VGWGNSSDKVGLAVFWGGVRMVILLPAKPFDVFLPFSSFGGSLDTLMLSFMLLAPAGSGGAIGVVVVAGLRVSNWVWRNFFFS